MPQVPWEYENGVANPTGENIDVVDAEYHGEVGDKFERNNSNITLRSTEIISYIQYGALVRAEFKECQTS